MIKKEIADALYVLLHCSLKDKEYKTQTEQFYCVYGYIKQLEEEIKEYQEELQKADSITQSCLLDEAKESTINFRQCLNGLALYKEVIEEVREYIDKIIIYQDEEGIVYFKEEFKPAYDELLQILDKAKEK